MRAVILAAGRGSRMGGLTDEAPKCLVELGGRPLLDWQLTALRGAGIARIGVVTGWRAERLEGRGLHGFHNPRWAETNMVMSLACAAEWLAADDCVVSYSDIFYPAEAVTALTAAEDGIAITYDPDWRALWSRRFADPLADAESFEVDGSGRLLEIGQRVDRIEKIQGQYMGLLRFTPAGWSSVAALLAGLAPAERDRLDMTSLLRRLLGQGERIAAVPVRVRWGEVDSATDLALYERELQAGA